MSRWTKSGPALARSVRCLGVVALLVPVSTGARAQDFFEFLNHAFGGGESRQPQGQLPQPAYAQPEGRPLTVRAHRRHPRPVAAGNGFTRSPGTARGGKYDVADLKNVTIYTDRTLSRGDAVMTPTGIKVFNGSGSWPYRDDDFVALSDGKLPSLVRKELTAMDSASRPALQPR